MLTVLLKPKLRFINALLDRQSPEKMLKSIVGIGVVLFFLVFGYWFFEYIFSYLNRLNEVGTMLKGKVLALAFFAVFVLLLISNLLTGISTIFKNKETAFLMTLPIGYRDIFISRTIDSFIFSTWAFAILGVPMMIAYGNSTGYPLWIYIPIIILVFTPFALIPASISSFILILYFRFIRNIEPKKFAFAIIAVIAAALFTYLKTSAPENLSLYTYQDWRILNNYLSGMALSSAPWLPSSWGSACLQEIAVKNFKGAAVFMLTLISTALFFCQVNIIASGLLLARGLQNSFGSGNSASKKPVLSRILLKPLQWRLIPIPRATAAMLYKDIATFFRDSAQWGQLSILAGLALIYLFNLRYFPANLSDPFWKSVIAFANFAFMGFILATLSVRFVFPTISLEGKAFWLVKSSPVKIASVFWEKFLIAFIFFAGLSEILAIISSTMLGLPPLMLIINQIGVLLVSLSLTGLSIGLGAYFPDFDEPNPSRISSGAGGMIAAIISLVYVCVIVVLLAYPTHLYTKYLTEGNQINTNAALFSFASIIIISLITFILPVLTGLRNLKRYEF